MATAYAFSVIKERDADGNVKIYNPGDKLDGLNKERVAHLMEVGAAATYDRTKSTGQQVAESHEEQDKLRDRVAELEAQLAEATKAQAASSSSEKVSGSSSSTGSSASGSSSSGKSTSGSSGK